MSDEKIAAAQHAVLLAQSDRHREVNRATYSDNYDDVKNARRRLVEAAENLKKAKAENDSV